jgi:hypothetical protein
MSASVCTILLIRAFRVHFNLLVSTNQIDTSPRSALHGDYEKGSLSISCDIARYFSSGGLIGFRSAFQKRKMDIAMLNSLRHELLTAKG